LTDTAQS